MCSKERIRCDLGRLPTSELVNSCLLFLLQIPVQGACRHQVGLYWPDCPLRCPQVHVPGPGRPRGRLSVRPPVARQRTAGAPAHMPLLPGRVASGDQLPHRLPLPHPLCPAKGPSGRAAGQPVPRADRGQPAPRPGGGAGPEGRPRLLRRPPQEVPRPHRRGGQRGAQQRGL